MRKILCTLAMSILMGVVTTNAQQESVDQSTSASSKQTNYEKFLARTDAIIVTQAHPLATIPNGAGDATANVAWVLGEENKIYAAYIGGVFVDFERLKELQDGLDKMIQAVNNSFDKLNAASVSYSSPSGLNVSYYTYKDSAGKPRRNLILTMGSYTSQTPTTEPLSEFRNLIAQAREKLISLGAR